MPESVFTQTIPLLFAAGVGLVVAALVDGDDEFEADWGSAAGLFAGALEVDLDPGADAGLLAGVGFPLGAEVVGAVSALTDDSVFLDLLFSPVVDAELAGLSAAADLLAVAVSAASVPLLFRERRFAVVPVSAALAVLSGASADFFARLFFLVVELLSVVLAAELSAASAVLLFFDRLFLAVVVSSEAAASVLAAAFFFVLDLEVFAESAVASALLCEASAAAFFLLFFFAVVLVSLWSDEPDCRAPRVVTLPQISSIAAINAKTTPLLDLILLPPSASVCLAGWAHYAYACV